MRQLPPRFVIAAPQGRSGKTTAAIAIGRGLRRRGIEVRPFKKGPDFIDPSWLSAACERTCYNLDAFLMGEELMMRSFTARSEGADVAMVEGAMGLFDGPGPGAQGTVAALARGLGAPVVLVVNASRMTRSIAAMVSGYQHFEPDTDIAGVVLNHVAGSRHEARLTAALREHCGIPVLGALPKERPGYMAERHLGLVPVKEDESAEAVIESVYRCAKDHIDLEGILEVARKAAVVSSEGLTEAPCRPVSCSIGVFCDRAFNFYYPENLEALKREGAEVVFIDSLHEGALPDVDGLYIGGGFPEMHAKELEANDALRHRVRVQIEAGMPVYAECGGMMYLSRGITWKGARYEMVGAIPAETELSDRPAGHGYVEAEVVAANPFFEKGQRLRGHEFHHSRLTFNTTPQYACSVMRGHGVNGRSDGFFYKNLFAAFMHVHALGVPGWAPVFAAMAEEYRRFQRGMAARARLRHVSVS
jgi:cobyrinic acid a,c-diamide synthase